MAETSDVVLSKQCDQRTDRCLSCNRPVGEPHKVYCVERDPEEGYLSPDERLKRFGRP